MTKKTKTQQTPQGHKIPIPTKEEFERNLDKVAKPVEISPPPYPNLGSTSSPNNSTARRESALGMPGHWQRSTSS